MCVTMCVCVLERNRLIAVWGVTSMAKGSDCRARSTELKEEEEKEEGRWGVDVAWEWW